MRGLGERVKKSKSNKEVRGRTGGEREGMKEKKTNMGFE